MSPCLEAASHRVSSGYPSASTYIVGGVIGFALMVFGICPASAP
jgi:hypothetical protein